MNAKLVCEDVTQFLKPKSDDEIDYAINTMSINDLLSSNNSVTKTNKFWDSLIRRGMSIEEVFRVAINNKSDFGTEYCLKNGAKGTLITNKDLLNSISYRIYRASRED